MVELRADGAYVRHHPADILQQENENIDTGKFCQDLVARFPGMHADNDCNKYLEVL